jgi:hypothetical protein
MKSHKLVYLLHPKHFENLPLERSQRRFVHNVAKTSREKKVAIMVAKTVQEIVLGYIYTMRCSLFKGSRSDETFTPVLHSFNDTRSGILWLMKKGVMWQFLLCDWAER